MDTRLKGRPDFIVIDDKESEYENWLRNHPEADPEAIREIQRRLREIRLEKHLNTTKTVK
ncbi:hypothetical protein ACR777_05510 [Sphingobacterium spiritivorum]|uniref:hypothetical protein n=1 Tax=Sphingobacterium TaxID=28453 RepID=UPI0025D41B26|nr:MULTISPECIES: hypothetical protein [unclassified Sphingobacterium]